MTDKDNAWKLVPLERSYDMRARAILAFNTATANGADRDDALQAAWEAEYHAAPQNRQKDNESTAITGDGMAPTDEQIVIAGMNHFSRCEVPEAMLSYIAAVRECLALAAPAAPAPNPKTHLQQWSEVIEQLPVSREAAPAPAAQAEGLEIALDAAHDALLSIGNFAHDKSTGPAVPDALWEIRSMAYDAVSSVFAGHAARRQHHSGEAAPDTEIEALFEGRAENMAVISANHAVNSDRTEIIARAVAAHGRAWPEQLTSGVMFYDGERITKAEFMAEVGR
ncbi:hypothetical protein [Cupriavidus sp.]|uniref:hypothetical protein n=1 Tax=Cupriavidus sp. TaxID=1873897 RepID=UPI0025C52B8D|nr:hypothetical protein [Cupriavidus sp.]MCA3190955.1 hypothetical protein [Cupriavidus sp.]MCA3199299.1 hypothetical protein [Cupriavidus sp.]MCA3204566.1 hypothetical protein [Cupriavidus sp.]MCA3207735.1 hypothetical protein [Cupriavidus sp.]MCA3233444.1 hypothetical protein [Cupriavidus sp.]